MATEDRVCDYAGGNAAGHVGWFAFTPSRQLECGLRAVGLLRAKQPGGAYPLISLLFSRARDAPWAGLEKRPTSRQSLTVKSFGPVRETILGTARNRPETDGA
jgi:hypothetical protein